jgi:hypothetical protein
MREPVSFPRVLRGQGHEATCAIDAIKASLPGTDEFSYTNYSIRWVSKELPESVYELTANGENTRVQLRNGFWIAA